MADTKLSDIDVLMPKPFIHKVAGEELRQQALPIRKLLLVVQFVEKNSDLLNKFQLLGKSEEDGGVALSTILEKDVYTRVNSLIRLLLPGHEDLLTDDWCLDHLSNAHYFAIIKTALVQNQLYELFNKAKDLVGPAMAEVFRQNMARKAAPQPVPVASV